MTAAPWAAPPAGLAEEEETGALEGVDVTVVLFYFFFPLGRLNEEERGFGILSNG